MIVKYAFAVGLVVRRGNRLFEFDRKLSDNTVIFIDALDKCPHRWQISDVHKDVQSGKLTVVLGDSEPKSGAEPDGLPMLINIESLPAKHRDAVNKKIDYVQALRRLGLSRGMRAALRQAIPLLAQRFQDSDPPSESSVMRWWRKLEENDNVVHALISGHVHKKLPLRKDWASGIILQTIQREYCSRKRPTIKETTDSINKKLETKVREYGHVCESDANVSYTTVRRYIRQIDRFALDNARYGASYAKNKWRYSQQGVDCSRAQQRYEIDHTILDIVVVCDRTGMPLGRPTITVVVDAYSSYVVGFFISFWGAGLATTLSCLKVAFSPKSQYLNGAITPENAWLGMGVCELMVMDNGLEFHSPQLRSIARHLDMDMLFCPVRTPWLKPVVERTMGSLGRYLPSQGRVEKPMNNYIPLRPEETSTVTFSSLCQGLLMAFVDVHPFEINIRKMARPFDLMSESLERLPPPLLPGPMDQLDIIVGESTNKVIGQEGVVMNYLRYNTPELQKVCRAHGRTFMSEVRYDPGDLDRIYVRVPDSSQWLTVPSCYPAYTEGLSTVQHRAVRNFAKAELKRRNADEVLMRAKRSLQEHWMGAVQTGKRLKTQQLKAVEGLTSAHVLAVERPTHTTQQAPICLSDMTPAEHDIPLFESVQFR